MEEVQKDMADYKTILRLFIEKTPLTLFCTTQHKRRTKLSPDFKEIVAHFHLPDSAVLNTVELFRQEYSFHYNLQDSAMMFAKVALGSFCITWFVPESIITRLKDDIPQQILKNHCVIKLEIDGEMLYTQEVSPSTNSALSLNSISWHCVQCYIWTVN